MNQDNSTHSLHYRTIVLLGLLVALTPLGTDTVVPALPNIADQFAAPVAHVQFVITGFFLGISIGQIVWGPLSDHFGRKSVLLFALALQLILSAACAAASSVIAIALLRAAQGFSMACGPVVARAVVRDLFSHEKAAQVFASMMVVFGVVPIAAPLVGARLLVFGWEAVFLFLVAMTALLFAWVFLDLKETAPRRGGSVKVAATIQIFGNALKSHQFIAAVSVLICAQAGLFAFVTNSAFVFVRALGVGASEYAVLFAIVMCGQIAGAWMSGRLVIRLGITRMLAIGTAITCFAGIATLLLSYGDAVNSISLAIACMIYVFGVSWITPNAMASALTPFGQSAGTVSSLIGFLMFLVAAAIGVLLGILFDGSSRPMAMTLATGGVAAFIANWLRTRRPVQAKTAD